MNKMSLICAAALAGLAPLGASAQGEADLSAAFAKADENADGYVDVNEYVAYVVSVYATLDKNRDGEVSARDVPNVDAARFARIDRSGDGMVSLGEAVAERMIVFFDVDGNRDGVLTLSELLDFEAGAGS